jgi:hypothetical protein
MFVLLVNRDQIESYIRTVYGEVDARAFLLKFGTAFVELPDVQDGSYSYVRGRYEYCQSLVHHFGISAMVDNSAHLTACLSYFTEFYCLTLREIERVVGMLAFYYASKLNSQASQPLLETMLAVIRLKDPLFYRRLRNGIESAKDFCDHAKFDFTMVKRHNFNPEWAKFVLDSCVMSKAEFDDATKAEKMSSEFSVNLTRAAGSMRDRRMEIPNLCLQLDRFSIPS